MLRQQLDYLSNMKVSRRTKRIVAGVAMVMNAWLMIMSIQMLYNYHFPTALYAFMYPDWVLWTCIVMSGIGIYLSLLLWKEKLRLERFLILMLLIGLVDWGGCSYDLKYNGTRTIVF